MYMYLFWSRGRGPRGPKSGKPAAKTYIGRERGAQALAREMVANRVEWEELARQEVELTRRLASVIGDLGGMAWRVERLYLDAAPSVASRHSPES